jgi:hypothetical protein
VSEGVRDEAERGRKRERERERDERERDSAGGKRALERTTMQFFLFFLLPSF